MSIKIDYSANLSDLKKEMKRLEDAAGKAAKPINKDINKITKTLSDAEKAQTKYTNKVKQLQKQQDAAVAKIGNNEKQKAQIVKQYQNKIEAKTKQHEKMMERLVKRGEQEQTNALRKALSQRENLTKQSAKKQEKLSKMATGIGGALPGLAGTIAGGAGLAGAGIALTQINQLMNGFADKARLVEERIGYIKTLLDPGDYKFLETIKVRAEETAAATGASVEEILRGAYQALSAGSAQADNISDYMDRTAKFAKALGTGVEESALAVGGVLNSLGWAAEDAGKAMDILSWTMKKGVIAGGGELAQYFPLITKGMQVAGFSAEEMGAAVASTTGQGIQIAEAATAINGFSRSLIDSATAAKLAKLGVEGYDAEARRVTDSTLFMASMTEKFKNNTNELMDAFGNIRAQRAIMTLFADTDKGWISMSEQAKGYQGQMEIMFSAIAETGQNRMDRIAQQWEGMQSKMGEGWAKVQVDFLGGLVSLFETGEQRATQHIATMETVKAQAEGIQKILSQGLAVGQVQPMDLVLDPFGAIADTQANMDSFFSNVKNNLEGIALVSKVDADLLKEVLDRPEGATVENVKEVNSILSRLNQELNDLAVSEAFAALDDIGKGNAFEEFGKQASGAILPILDNIQTATSLIQPFNVGLTTTLGTFRLLNEVASGKNIEESLYDTTEAMGFFGRLMRGTVRGLTEFFTEGIPAIFNTVKSVIDSVTNYITNTFNKMISDLSMVGNAIGSVFSSGATAAVDFTQQVREFGESLPVIGGVITEIGKAFDWLKQTAFDTFESIGNGIAGVATWLHDAALSIPVLGKVLESLEGSDVPVRDTRSEVEKLKDTITDLTKQRLEGTLDFEEANRQIIAAEKSLEEYDKNVETIANSYKIILGQNKEHAEQLESAIRSSSEFNEQKREALELAKQQIAKEDKLSEISIRLNKEADSLVSTGKIQKNQALKMIINQKKIEISLLNQKATMAAQVGDNEKLLGIHKEIALRWGEISALEDLKIDTEVTTTLGEIPKKSQEAIDAIKELDNSIKGLSDRAGDLQFEASISNLDEFDQEVARIRRNTEQEQLQFFAQIQELVDKGFLSESEAAERINQVKMNLASIQNQQIANLERERAEKLADERQKELEERMKRQQKLEEDLYKSELQRQEELRKLEQARIEAQKRLMDFIYKRQSAMHESRMSDLAKEVLAVKQAYEEQISEAIANNLGDTFIRKLRQLRSQEIKGVITLFISDASKQNFEDAANLLKEMGNETEFLQTQIDKMNLDPLKITSETLGLLTKERVDVLSAEAQQIQNDVEILRLERNSISQELRPLEIELKRLQGLSDEERINTLRAQLDREKLLVRNFKDEVFKRKDSVEGLKRLALDMRDAGEAFTSAQFAGPRLEYEFTKGMDNVENIFQIALEGMEGNVFRFNNELSQALSINTSGLQNQVDQLNGKINESSTSIEILKTRFRELTGMSDVGFKGISDLTSPEQILEFVNRAIPRYEDFFNVLDVVGESINNIGGQVGDASEEGIQALSDLNQETGGLEQVFNAVMENLSADNIDEAMTQINDMIGKVIEAKQALDQKISSTTDEDMKVLLRDQMIAADQTLATLQSLLLVFPQLPEKAAGIGEVFDEVGQSIDDSMVEPFKEANQSAEDFINGFKELSELEEITVPFKEQKKELEDSIELMTEGLKAQGLTDEEIQSINNELEKSKLLHSQLVELQQQQVNELIKQRQLEAEEIIQGIKDQILQREDAFEFERQQINRNTEEQKEAFQDNIDSQLLLVGDNVEEQARLYQVLTDGIALIERERIYATHQLEIQAIADTIDKANQIADTAFNFIESSVDILSNTTKKTIGETIASMGSQIGSTISQLGGPIGKAVGAALSTISKIVGKIAQQIRESKEVVDLDEERRKENEKLLQVIEDQRKIQSQIAKITGDSAIKRIKALRKEYQLIVNVNTELRDLTREQLVDQLKLLDIRKQAVKTEDDINDEVDDAVGKTSKFTQFLAKLPGIGSAVKKVVAQNYIDIGESAEDIANEEEIINALLEIQNQILEEEKQNVNDVLGLWDTFLQYQFDAITQQKALNEIIGRAADKVVGDLQMQANVNLGTNINTQALSDFQGEILKGDYTIPLTFDTTDMVSTIESQISLLTSELDKVLAGEDSAFTELELRTAIFEKQRELVDTQETLSEQAIELKDITQSDLDLLSTKLNLTNEQTQAMNALTDEQKKQLLLLQDDLYWIQQRLDKSTELGLTDIEINDLLIEQAGITTDINDLILEGSDILATRHEDEKEALDDARKAQNDLLQFQLDQLRHQRELSKLSDEQLQDMIDRGVLTAKEVDDIKKIGDLTEDDYVQRQVDLLTDQLDLLPMTVEFARDRWKIEDEINDLIHEQTDSLKEQDTAQIEALTRRRQQLIEMARATGTIASPEMQAQLDQLEGQIRAEMVAQGFDNQTIEDALQAFREQRSFEEGGEVDYTGSASVHGSKSRPEYVVSAPAYDATESVMPGLMESLNMANTPEAVINTIKEYSSEIQRTNDITRSIANISTNTSIEVNNNINTNLSGVDTAMIMRKITEMNTKFPELTKKALAQLGYKQSR